MYPLQDGNPCDAEVTAADGLAAIDALADTPEATVSTATTEETAARRQPRLRVD
jgi:hypothetical protein